MPEYVFWTKRSLDQAKKDEIPLPNLNLLPSQYHSIYPEYFTKKAHSDVEIDDFTDSPIEITTTVSKKWISRLRVEPLQKKDPILSTLMKKSENGFKNNFVYKLKKCEEFQKKRYANMRLGIVSFIFG